MNAAGMDHELAPGDVFAFFPGVHYRYRDVRHRPWRYTWCVLEGAAVPAALERAGLTERSPRLSGDFATCLEDLFLETEQLCAPGPAPAFFAASAAWRLLDRLQRLTAGGPPAPDTDVVVAAHALIDLRFMTRISVEEVARQLGIDRSTLFRRFRERYGLSPKQYLDQVRLSHARRLLRDTGATVRTVAALSGFEDSHYFSRVYRRAFGVPPSADR